MRRASRWTAFLAIITMTLVMLLAGLAAAAAEEPPEGPAGEELAGQETGQEGDSGETTSPTNGVIEAMVWEDLDGDGEYDEGEPFVDGVTVRLFHLLEGGTRVPVEDCYDGPYEKQTGSGAYGMWAPFGSFPPPYEHGWVGWMNLPTTYDGKPYAYYELEVVPPEGYVATCGLTRVATLRDTCWWQAFNHDFALEKRGFGIYEPTLSSISGAKWHDKNADGVRQSSEPLLSGWTIVLTRDRNKVASTETGADGSFIFSDLEPGSYQVWEVDRWCWKQVYPLYGPCEWPPSCCYARGHYDVEVEAGEIYEGCDFGNLKMNSFCAWYYYNKWLCRLYRSWW